MGLLDALQLIARASYTPQLNPSAGGVYAGADGNYHNAVTNEIIPEDKALDTKNYPDNQIYRQPGFWGRLTPAGQNAITENMNYAATPITGQQTREQASLNSDSETSNAIARAARFSQQSPTENEYLAGTGALNPTAMSGMSTHKEDLSNGVYPAQALARKSLASVAPAVVPGEITRENSENTLASDTASGKDILANYDKDIYRNPMFGINYKNAQLNNSEAGNIASQAGINKAGVERALAREASANEDELGQIQGAERSGAMFNSRYIDLGLGRALDTVTKQIVPNPRWNMQSILGQSMAGGGINNMAAVTGPDGKTYHVPFTQKVDIFRSPLGSRTQVNNPPVTENTKPTTEKPPQALSRLPSGTGYTLGKTIHDSLSDIVSGIPYMYHRAGDIIRPAWNYIGGVNQ